MSCGGNLSEMNKLYCGVSICMGTKYKSYVTCHILEYSPIF